MNENYVKALLGTLTSNKGKGAITIKIKNGFDVTITAVFLDSKGFQDVSTMATIKPGESKGFEKHQVGDWFLITATSTGGFMSAVEVKAGKDNEYHHTVGPQHLASPNDIGPIPESTPDVPIPPDWPRVVVGCTKLGNGHQIIREQCWHRSSDSYSLAPLEERTVNLSSLSGRQTTSSTESEVSKSLDAGLDIGWGPISASISSSLSATTTGFQQVTVTEQSTSFVSVHVPNNSTTQSMLVLAWQLIDCVTVSNKDGKAISSVNQATSPTIMVTTPYPPPIPAVAARPAEPDPLRYPERLERRFALQSPAS